MSKQEKKNAAPGEQAEKVITKYDLKMQKRKAEKEKEARAQKISTAVGIVILLALLCLVLSFPIRSYISLHKTYVTVGNENVTKVEFDYSYYTVVNNYVAQYSQYLSMFGLDLSKDLSTQYYSGTRTWKDFFEEMTMDTLRRNKALKADAQATGFTVDVSAEYEGIVAQQKANAQEAGVSLNKYLRQNFGSYATSARIKPYLEEALYVNKYYAKLSKDMTPSADEVSAKYAENPKQYDSVNYRIKQFDAQLPTEPTELADPKDESAETDADAAYTPSEAEVEKAMADAKAIADEALGTVKTDGDVVEGILYDSANNVIRDWLFDDARKAGDTTVLEDSGSHCYYCLAFEKRFRDETATANVRILVSDTEEEANSMFAAWKDGGATEPHFEELCNTTFYDKAVAEGGLLEGISKDDDLYEELLDWIFAEGRSAGNCEVVTVPDVASFVVYYIGEGQPIWYKTIESNLRNDAVTAYVEKLEENCQISDPDKNLNYLILEEQEKAAAESAAAENAATESSVEESTAAESSVEESTAAESAAEESTATESTEESQNE